MHKMSHSHVCRPSLLVPRHPDESGVLNTYKPAGWMRRGAQGCECWVLTSGWVAFPLELFQNEEFKLQVFLMTKREEIFQKKIFLLICSFYLCWLLVLWETVFYLKIASLSFIIRKKIINSSNALAVSQHSSFPCITFYFDDNVIIHSFPASNCNFLNEQL